MSREIKFRVWEEREKAYNTWTFILDTLGNLFRNVYGALIGCNEKDYIVEQDTGLKDRNGKEIYEGDVVLDYYDGDDAFIVKWDEDTASFILTGTDNIAAVSFDNFFPNEDLEVIGNIHENPELLGGEE